MAEELRVLVRPEGDFFVAQCLEYDIAAQGRNMAELRARFAHMVLGHLTLAVEKGEPPFANLEKAPQWYWDRYEESESDETQVDLPSPPKRPSDGAPRRVRMKAA